VSDKPSYLGLLNAIAVAESRAHTYLTAWLAKTTDPAVRCVLSTVAAREGEHGMSFAKRIDELGYSVREREDARFDKQLAVAASDRTDLEKMEKLGLGRLDTGTGPDIFDDVFKDHSIDIATGALLGRYIAEERDSARLLRGCHEQLKARHSAAGGSGGSADSAAADRIGALDAKLDALCVAVGELRHLVAPTAAAGAAAAANGRTRSKSRT
jgi:hypothetical protein